MHLHTDLAIRRACAPILPDDIAIGVGEGWGRIVRDALIGIRDIHPAIRINQIKEKMGGLVIYADTQQGRLSWNAGERIEAVRRRASDRSLVTCELCGLEGRLLHAGAWRVRCDPCEAEHAARERIIVECAHHVREACAYYIATSLSGGGLSEVADVVMTVGGLTEREHAWFVDLVHDRLTWWRAGSRIDGVDERLREPFRSLAVD